MSARAKSRAARAFAEVALTLDNADRLAPAGFNDTDALEVTRRITRDAGSASGGLQSFQQVGAALGVALIAEIFFAVLGGGSYVPALRMALVYEMAAYATVALLALTLPPLAAPAPAAANAEA